MFFSSTDMFEIRFHGRGGQGAVMAAQTLADAAVRSGYKAQAFPYFGAERRGAPVEAYARIDADKIRTKSQVQHPHLLVIMDASLADIDDLASGLRPDGRIVMNTPLSPEEVDLGAGVNAACGTVDATAIALETLKMPIVNTAMLGAIAKIWEVIALEAIVEAIEDRFGGKLGARAGLINGEAARRAYDAVAIGITRGTKVYGKRKAWMPVWDEIPIGTSLRSATHDGMDVGPNSSWQNLTGRWKWSTPRYKKEKCIKCLRCWWSCPDSAVIRQEDDYMRWDLDHCKGCGICAEICPVDAIDMMPGVRDTWQ
jgi:2-oxoacid:acceptor oxidoreductase gamma subunit (pyruvate/2-ketoisovalerate family)/2-oxoacid:acceptor oxidoreductase delta subunit (pyruvate/2-ketoisovalerate family)